MVPCKSTAEEVLLEWAHHRILSIDFKVRTAIRTCIFIIDSLNDCLRATIKKYISLVHYKHIF